MTEVGEKGISLSGGQKQRLNICRAIYCDTEIQIFDDPLSALDAHVGKAVFQNVLQNNPQGRTRILVTHALHFLPLVDYIYVMFEGRVVERGTYAELMASNGAFSRFVLEFGSKEEQELSEEMALEKPGEQEKKVRKQMGPGAQLMQAEERNTGAVSGAVYGAYFKAGNGKVVLPLLFIALLLMQGTSVMSSYWCVSHNIHALCPLLLICHCRLVYWQEL
jgi:ABC-type multidrug transport system ATPase subunit